MTSVRTTGRHIGGSEFMIGNRNFNVAFTAASSERIGFEALNYKTNATWADIFVQAGEDNYPVLTEDQYGKGRLFVLNVPENFADLYKLVCKLHIQRSFLHISWFLHTYYNAIVPACQAVFCTIS